MSPLSAIPLRCIVLTMLLVPGWGHAGGLAASLGTDPAPPQPMREYRAAWIATMANIDWPSRPGLPANQQKAELISLIDRAAALHFNAIFFQVRPLSDAVYPSAMEPWSEFLTGRQGQSPSPWYDPLALAITEAHLRGLQLHAWFNPFRAGHPLAKSPPAANQVIRTHPEWVVRYGTQTVVDPGQPAGREHVLAVISDVVRRYDVDGILLDDYFYPYPEKDHDGRAIDFPDTKSWLLYGVHSGLSRDDWRRDNVNRFVLNLATTLKSIKPWVQFGISPFGIWRPQYPPSVRGFDAYDRIFADSRRWLASGWVDYLTPQLYWSMSAREQGFPVLLDWWRGQNAHGRHVWPSLEDAAVGGKFSSAEIGMQIERVRHGTDPGEAHYHLRSILDNPDLARVVGAMYASPALVPLSPWLSDAQCSRPNLEVAIWRQTARLTWGAGPGIEPRSWLVQVHQNGAWFTQILPGNTHQCYLNQFNGDGVVVRAVSRLGELSALAGWKHAGTP